MDTIDLRSDTVTLPTDEMRKAMYQAEVGDDVYDEDPSINTLQEETADLLGKEAAIYCSSGTQTNQIGIWLNTSEGQEAIMERDCHVYNYEAGAPAMLGRVLVKLLPGKRGVLTAEQIQGAFIPGSLHQARTSLVCIENTHNKCGGTIYPLDEIRRISEFCRANDVRLHLDGARIWNASAATGISERDYAEGVDTVSVCFSKGLGAPVGSALCGSRDAIDEARKRRKILGGGMRQAGIIAAGALHALRHHRGRLVEDHANAQRLADGLRGMPGISIDPSDPETNILMIDITAAAPAARFAQRLADEGILINGIAEQRLRAVTHLGITEKDIDRVVGAFGKITKELAG